MRSEDARLSRLHSEQPTTAPSLRDHLVAAGVAGMALGGSAGALLALGFERLPYSSLVVRSAVERFAFVLLVVGVGAALCALALLPAVAIVAAWSRRRPLRTPPGLAYAALALAGQLFVLGFFQIVFNLTRRPASPLGAGWSLGLLLVCSATVWLLTRLGRGRPARRSTTRGATVVAMVWLAAATSALVAGRALAARSTGAPAAAPHSVAQHQPQPGRRPDILLISIDTLRADHLGAYGYPLPTSPNLDALAAQATRFEAMRTTAPWTLPAHASMLTGLYPAAHGAQFFSNFSFLRGGVSARLDPRFPTLAARLAEQGYATGAFTATTWLTPEFGVVRGFEKIDEETSRPAGETIDRLLSWRHEQRTEEPGRPLFLFAHFFDVHDYRSPRDFEGRFVDPGYRGELAGRAKTLMRNPFDHLGAADLSYATAEYDAALAYVDAEIGRLLAAMREDGSFDTTLVVVTADHGEEFWEHGGTGHGFTLYDEQLRVPLIVKPPAGESAGVPTSAVLASTVDIVPTVLDYVGASPATLDGLSLRGAIGGSPAPRRVVFAGATYFFNSAAAISGTTKLIEHRVPPLHLFDPGLALANLRSFYKFRGPEVFDLERDPFERRSLAVSEGRSLRPALVLHLRRGARGRSSALRLDAATRQELEALGYVD